MRLKENVRLRFAVERVQEQSSGNVQLTRPALGFEKHRAAAVAAKAAMPSFARYMPAQMRLRIHDLDMGFLEASPRYEPSSVRALAAGAVAVRNPLRWQLRGELHCAAEAAASGNRIVHS